MLKDSGRILKAYSTPITRTKIREKKLLDVAYVHCELRKLMFLARSASTLPARKCGEIKDAVPILH